MARLHGRESGASGGGAPVIRYWWVGLVILAAGFLVGRCSVPRVDEKLLGRVDSLNVTEPGFNAGRDTTHRIVERAEHVTDSLEAVAANLAASGRKAQTRALASERRADSLEAVASALTDTSVLVPTLRGVIGELRFALAESKAAHQHADSAYREQTKAVDSLRPAVARLKHQVTQDSLRLIAQKNVIDGLSREHTGCRVPVLKIRCPVIGPGYSATLADGQVHHGPSLNVIYPVIGQ